MLLAARAIAALGAGMVTPVAAAIAAATSPPEQRGSALSFVIMGLSLAQAGGIPIGSFLGYTAGWRATFWFVVAISVAGARGSRVAGSAHPDAGHARLPTSGGRSSRRC